MYIFELKHQCPAKATRTDHGLNPASGVGWHTSKTSNGLGILSRVAPLPLPSISYGGTDHLSFNYTW